MTLPNEVSAYPILRLKKGHDRRVLRGHPWIFSNELQELPDGLGAGALVQLRDSRDRFAGIGYFNPHPLIAVRLLRREAGVVDEEFLRSRLDAALDLRERLYPEEEALRLVYSESDGLPGLVVDRYADHLVVQVTTAGMDRLFPVLLTRLEERLHPRCVVARNDTSFRSLEGLPLGVEVLSGVPDEALTVRYEGLTLAVDLLGGQKTGLFLDQRDNQRQFLPRVASGEVLDCYCYQGTWGLLALTAGADRVTGVDASADALALAEQHAKTNGFAARTEYVRGDVLEVLKAHKAAGDRFDTVILDPPAFVKSKRHVKAGLRGYLDLNRKGLEIVRPGGTLITCSCSHHVRPEVFRDTVAHAASLAGRGVQVLGVGTQARDHAPLLTAPETDYLKCLVLHVAV